MKEIIKKYVNRPGNESLQAKTHAVLGFVRSQPRPILVYQMGKVGSTSVCRSLREAGYHPLHVHFLTEPNRKVVEDLYTDVGILPTHYYTERLLRPYLNWTNHRLRVISLVRDPIARSLSGSFQWPLSRSLASHSAEKIQRTLVEQLSRPEALEYVFTWFDRELKETLGVDVMKESFNRREGYGLYRGPRAEVLVVKLEQLSDLLPTVLSDFVDVSRPLRNSQANVGSEKGKGHLYAEVKRTLRLPQSVCDEVYGHEWVRHFYTEEEIATFKRKWSGPDSGR